MAVNVRSLARIALNAADPGRLAEFYEAGFGFVREGDADWPGEAVSRLFGATVEAARVVTLRLGEQRIDLVGLTPDGAPCADVPGNDLRFQHFAIVVADMERAYRRLSGVAGWRPISRDGPQRLPASSGGVTAYKFRDPEGHPLELLAFPDGGVPTAWREKTGTNCLGIDHSAISVADTDRSLAFYRTLGFRVSSRSRNRGPEQARLDGIDAPDVAVTGLSLPGEKAPHVELLCYRSRPGPLRSAPPVRTRAVDGIATRLVLSLADAADLAAACGTFTDALVSPGPVGWPDGRVAALLRDPDGHHLLLTAPA